MQLIGASGEKEQNEGHNKFRTFKRPFNLAFTNSCKRRVSSRRTTFIFIMPCYCLIMMWFRGRMRKYIRD